MHPLLSTTEGYRLRNNDQGKSRLFSFDQKEDLSVIVHRDGEYFLSALEWARPITWVSRSGTIPPPRRAGARPAQVISAHSLRQHK